MQSSNQTPEDIYGLLVKNIEICKKAGNIDLFRLLNSIDIQSNMCNFLNQFFSQESIPIKFGEPTISLKKVSLSLINIALLNAKDVSFEISFESNDNNTIDTKLTLSSKEGIDLAELAGVLLTAGVKSSHPALPPEYSAIGSIRLFKFSVAFNSQLVITNTAFEVQAQKAWQISGLDKFSFSTGLDISIDYPLISENQKINGKLTGKQDLGDKGCLTFEAALAEDFSMELKADKIKLTNLVELCAGELPAIIPDTTASLDLKLKWLKDAKNWEVHFETSTECTWDIEGQPLEITLEIKYDREASKKGEMQYGGSLNMIAKSSIPISDDISLKKLKFHLEKEKEKEKWVMDGGLDISLYEVDFTLKAGYEGSAKSQTITLSSTKKEGNIPIPLTETSIKDFEFELKFEKKEKSSSISGSLTAALQLPASVELGITSKIDKEKLELKVSAKEIKLSALSEALSIELPDVIPEIEMDTDFTVTKDKKGWSFDFDLTAKTEWQYEQVKIDTNTTIKLTSDAGEKSRNTYGSFSFTADNTFKLIDELQLKQFNVGLTKEKEGKWKADSKSKLIFFEKEFQLGVEYVYDKKQTLKFFVGSIGVIDLLPEIIQLDLKKIELSVTREKDKATRWELSSNGMLSVTDVFTLGGELKLGTEGLEYKPEAKVDIKLQIPPAEPLMLSLGLNSLAIKKEKANAKAGNNWTLSAESTLTIGGLPAFCKDLGITKELKVKFTANSNGIGLELIDSILDAKIKLPDILLEEGQKIEFSNLGTFSFKFSDLAIKLGKEISFGITMGVAAPDELNNMFGVDKQKQPLHKFFVTSSTGTVDFRFKLGYIIKEGKFGVEFQLESSPFTMITIEDKENSSSDDKKKVWNCDFGEFGKISFTIPSISLSEKGFGVKGEASGLKSLSIPLTLIKNFLTNVVHTPKKTVDLLPDKLRLADIKVIDDKGNLKIDELIDLLSIGIKLPDEVKKAIKAITGPVNRLPGDLKEYFNSSIPDSFSIDINISTSTIEIDAKVSEPVLMLYPSMDGLLPVLQGIHFTSFSLGMLFGGQMFKTKINAEFDQFDLISLAAGLLIPKESLLPICYDFKRKIIIKDLLMYIPIIEVEGIPIPIPIPIFYKELGIEYMGIEGIGLQAHAQFPEPEFDLLYLLKFLMSVYEFVTKPEKRLLEIPRNNDLVFSLDNCYLELPKYIINNNDPVQRRYGGLDKFYELRFGDTLVKLFNTIKFMKLSDLVNAIPEEFRKNKVKGKIDFMGWDFEIDWNIQSKSNPTSLMQLQDTGSDNIYAYLHGNSSSPIGNLDGTITLINDGSKGFLSNYNFNGNLLNGQLFSVNLEGYLFIDTSKSVPVVKLHDSSSFLLFKKNVFSQKLDIIYDEKGLELDGNFQLFDEGCLIQAKGAMRGYFNKNDFKLEGKTTLNIAGIEFAGFDGYLSPTDVHFIGFYLGIGNFTLNVLGEANQNTCLHGTMNLLGATVDLKAEVDRQNFGNSKFTYIYNLPGFIRVDALMDPISAGGTFNTTYMGLPIIDGKLTIAQNLVKFNGQLNFPGKDFIVGLFSGMEGEVNQSGIYYHGEGSFRLGAMSLAGYKIIITPNSFTASGDFLGSSLKLTISDEQERYSIIDGTVAILGCPLHQRISIDRTSTSLTNNSLHIDYSIPNVLELSGDMAHIGQEGSYKAKLFGFEIMSGGIIIIPSGFKVTGSLSFGIVGFLFSGSIGVKGFCVEGTFDFGIGHATLKIENGEPTISVTVAFLNAKGKIGMFNGEVTLMFEIGDGKTRTYYWINSRLGFSFSRPGGWPMNEIINHEDIKKRELIFGETVPRYPLEEALETAVSIYTGSNHDEVEKKLGEIYCATLYDYHTIYSCVPDSVKEQITDWTFTFYKPENEDLFFTPLIAEYCAQTGNSVSECFLNGIESMECRFVFDGTRVSTIKITIRFVTVEEAEMLLTLGVNNLKQMKKELINGFIIRNT